MFWDNLMSAKLSVFTIVYKMCNINNNGIFFMIQFKRTRKIYLSVVLGKHILRQNRCLVLILDGPE